MRFRFMTEYKLQRWQRKLASAIAERNRQAMFIGERFGAIKATQDADREVRRIRKQIELLVARPR